MGENSSETIRLLFLSLIKSSFVSAIVLFAAGYYIANLIDMFILERIPLFFYSKRTLLIFFGYIFLWVIFCYIRARLTLKNSIKGQNNQLK